MRIAAAGAVVFDEHGRLLLLQRAKPPAAFSWSVPGGKCELDERPEIACVREVAEETGLLVEVIRWVGRVCRPAPGGEYVIDDFLCRVVGGALCAGDDAADAGWFSLAEMTELRLTTGLLQALADWKLLPD
jgi:8-oxo-dGTP diphosphatase